MRILVEIYNLGKRKRQKPPTALGLGRFLPMKCIKINLSFCYSNSIS